jgi:hypothetical protein
MSWEDTFRSWASPPGATEQAKCDNAVRAIRKAIEGSAALENRNIKVFAQGSYRNRTNVRIESDVDVCVLCDGTFFFDLPASATAEDFGITVPAPYSYPQFKSDVATALVNYFGTPNVRCGNKAFDVHSNTYRVEADVVACFEYHQYWDDGTHRTGTAFAPNSGGKIINFPQENYDNGVWKNDETGGRFKDVVRILKRLKYDMVDNGIAAAKSVPPYLIECLTWNVPKEGFGYDDYVADVRWSLAHVFNVTRNLADCATWCEVNDFKFLFHTSQPWTVAQAHAFASEAWDYLGYE